MMKLETELIISRIKSRVAGLDANTKEQIDDFNALFNDDFPALIKSVNDSLKAKD